jgi:hypothetical protein
MGILGMKTRTSGSKSALSELSAELAKAPQKQGGWRAGICAMELFEIESSHGSPRATRGRRPRGAAVNIRISTTQFPTPAKQQVFQLALIRGLEDWFAPGNVQFSFAPNGPSAVFQGLKSEERVLRRALTPQLKNRLASQFRPLTLGFIF